MLSAPLFGEYDDECSPGCFLEQSPSFIGEHEVPETFGARISDLKPAELDVFEQDEPWDHSPLPLL